MTKLITYNEARDRFEGVLKAAGIKVELYGEGRYSFFDVEFPDGAKHSSYGFQIKCDGLSHQRG